MQNILTVKTYLYRTVNVATVQAVIGGGVYRGKAPNDNFEENVEIISGANVNDYVQDGTLFVNYHIKDLKDGLQDETKLKAFADILLPLIEADERYQIIDDDTFVNDQRAGWSYYSVRVRVFSLNDNFVE